MPGVIDVFGIIKVLLAKKSGITNRDAPKNLRGSLLLCILASLTERALLPSFTYTRLLQNTCSYGLPQVLIERMTAFYRKASSQKCGGISLFNGINLSFS